MRAVDLTGRRFGQLTVTELFRAGMTKGTRKRTWWCACDCGGVSVVTGSNLLTGNTRSCGCERARLGLAKVVVMQEAKRRRTA